MYDRLMTCRGLPQRYGTQFRVVDESKNQYELFPLEDPVGVNQRRKALGLGALAGFD